MTATRTMKRAGSQGVHGVVEPLDAVEAEGFVGFGDGGVVGAGLGGGQGGLELGSLLLEDAVGGQEADARFGCPIFCRPAVKVTLRSQRRGTRVMSATAGERGAEGLSGARCRVVLRMTVVARQRAMPASIWLEMPKMARGL